MIRIDTLKRCGTTLTIELVGYIHREEFAILYDFLKSQAEEGITEVCIVANDVRALNPLLGREATRLAQLGLRLRFQQLPRHLKYTLEYWGTEAWIDDE
ncbi:MAG: hypothetical protein F4Y91_10485 [Gemmatimonadetes bacterium]|nr:hypothetical protein [Gemmatimonadota bacterium]MYB71214.1 hypothetical protein [Gemmatimonadota bacterium]